MSMLNTRAGRHRAIGGNPTSGGGNFNVRLRVKRR
ncbi:hypothetical protein L914_17513 [Phytophthora nicotianae]|uniref:Uncharacterized protein n=1 Tax=Phytophthora nicotianae TaxID=4792 RepID=W2MIV4_PHYNI|nr:hypothetical protein L916_11602 [Phytophthora nicotianae]ETM35618.1 hypothetical protein L914_17513 [Phytophthora nicotianae]